MISKETIKAAAKDAWIRSLCNIPEDVLEALKEAERKETNPRGKRYFQILIDNAEKARKLGMVICQDTGVPTFFIRCPLNFPYTDEIRAPFDEAMHELTLGEFPTRPMVVHPLTRIDRGDNTAERVPILHMEFDNSLDHMEIKAMPKGAGSGVWGTLSIMQPGVGVDGVKKFVVDSVLRAGSYPCPPVIVGVGIGGTLEEVAALATEASARPISQRHPEADIAALEEELKEALNLSQIGPMGMGGDTTVLAVNIEYAGTHRPWMPVAVNINCWPGRTAISRVYPDGSWDKE